MEMIYKSCLALIAALLFYACTEKESSAPFNHPDLSYEGRIVYQTEAAELSWPGTNVSMRFNGTGISAVLQDMDTANYYNVIIDGEVVSKIHTDTLKKSYTLASGLKEGTHTVQLFKRTEWDKGNVSDKDIKKIEKATKEWENATTKEERDKAHAKAEAIRNKYRDDNEIGRGDGYTIDKKTGKKSKKRKKQHSKQKNKYVMSYKVEEKMATYWLPGYLLEKGGPLEPHLSGRLGKHVEWFDGGIIECRFDAVPADWILKDEKITNKVISRECRVLTVVEYHETTHIYLWGPTK